MVGVIGEAQHVKHGMCIEHKPIILNCIEYVRVAIACSSYRIKYEFNAVVLMIQICKV